MNNILNGLNDSISIKLDEVFNAKREQYTIYSEEIKQGLKEPCFFIKLLISNRKQVVGNRYYHTQSFDIHYFPKSDLEVENEMLKIADELYEVLEYINYEDGLLRGTSMRHEVIDNVLHFFVDYNFYTYKKENKIYFTENDLDYKQEVKNG